MRTLLILPLCLLGLSLPIHALTMYPDQVADNVLFSELQEETNTEGDPSPIYGDPSVFGDSLLFTPIDFISTSSGGKSDQTIATFQGLISSLDKQGPGILSISVLESGDFGLSGSSNDRPDDDWHDHHDDWYDRDDDWRDHGDDHSYGRGEGHSKGHGRGHSKSHGRGHSKHHGGKHSGGHDHGGGGAAGATITSGLFVRILEVNVGGELVSDVILVNDVVVIDVSSIGEAGAWLADATVDVQAAVEEKYGAGAFATEVSFTFDDALATSSDHGSNAFVQKKDAVLAVVVPEPGTAALIAFGLLYLGIRQRRRA